MTTEVSLSEPPSPEEGEGNLLVEFSANTDS